MPYEPDSFTRRATDDLPFDDYREASRERHGSRGPYNRSRSRSRGRSRSRSPDRRESHRRPLSRSPRHAHGTDGDHYVPDYSRQGYTPAPRYDYDGSRGRDRVYGEGRRGPTSVMRADYDSPYENLGFAGHGEGMSPRSRSWSQVTDPYKGDTVVPFKAFAEYYKDKRGRTVDSDELEGKYSKYKEEFRRRRHETFFTTHKDDDWFRERYHPDRRREHALFVKPYKLRAYQTFTEELRQGALDSLCLDEAPRGAGDYAGAKISSGDEGNSVHPYQDQPNDTCMLFIRTIPPSISRKQVEELCATAEGFQHVTLGEPNPAKKFHRFGWVKFAKGTNMTKAMATLDQTKLDEFQFHFGYHRANNTTRSRYAPEMCNSLERLKKDLDQCQRLVSHFDQETNDSPLEEPVSGDDAMVGSTVELYGNHLISEHLGGRDGPHPDQSEADAVAQAKLALDLRMIYLRRVHLYCYYCGVECDDLEDLLRRCGEQHSRRQPSGTIQRTQGSVNWLANLDDRVTNRLEPLGERELLSQGGKSIDKEVEGQAQEHIERIEEGKYRCKLCNKLFKGETYVVKHIRNKHPDSVNLTSVQTEVDFFNNYVKDSHRYQSHIQGTAGGPGSMYGMTGNQGLMMGGYPGMGVNARLGAGKVNSPMMMGGGGMYMGNGFGVPPPSMMGMGMPLMNGMNMMGGGGGGAMMAGNNWGQFNNGMMGASPRSAGGPTHGALQGGLTSPHGARSDPRQVRSYVDLDAPAAGGGDMDGNNPYL
ncbi:hypothetical protein IWQ61_006372 [Dispira simplex]|nr:hypothetical protein IWQ61_006372 [Dispira simplex]